MGLSGTVSMRVGGQRIEVMGSEIEVPDGWAPEVPVRGTADARGEGGDPGSAVALRVRSGRTIVKSVPRSASGA